jgi:acetyl esterase/lipase
MVLRLVVWLALAAGIAWLWPHSKRHSSTELVEATGVRLMRRHVDRAGGSNRRTPLEIYLPPSRSVWERSLAAGDVPSATPAAPARSVGPTSGRIPEAARLRPAVIAIHGGSWTGGSPRLYRIDPENTVLRLARSGFVVVAPEYRLARPGHPSWPEVLDELREVVRWVRRHAPELEIDSDRIAALGQSAGGQLAALLATPPDHPGPDGVSDRVNAVIDFYGPSDLVRLVKTRQLTRDPVQILLGEPAKYDTRAPLREASPLDQIAPGSAPMLLLHGSDDAWVPPEQSARMADALEHAGVRHKLIVVAGARHGFEAQVNTFSRRDLLPDILEFLNSLWNRHG